MAGLSENAFAIMATCEETKQPFGITVEKMVGHHYRFMWSFKINREKAHREGYDVQSVTGTVDVDENYLGCPYCGSRRFYLCSCGRIVCYHGQRVATCPECGRSGELTTIEEISLKGGGY